MSYMESYCIRKGINAVSDYMASLGYKGCEIDDSNVVVYKEHPTKCDVAVTFSEKGRCTKVEKLLDNKA